MPFDGHFKPLTGIAVRLHELGHDVRWYAGPSYALALRELGIRHVPFSRAPEVNGDTIADIHPERAKLSGLKLLAFDFENVFAAHCEEHFLDLVDLHAAAPFDVLIADEGLYATQLVRARLGVPVYAVGVSPMMANSRDAPPNFFGLKPARTPIGRVRDRVVDAMVSSTMKPGLATYNDVLVRHGVAPLAHPREFFDVPTDIATTYFQSGVPGFEFPRSDLPGNVKFVGPLLPHPRAIAPQFAAADLDPAASVIVVSQGTVDNKDQDKLLAPALEALAGTEHLVVAATGGVNTAALRERFPADNVIVEDIVDFARLFDRSRLFIVNGGYGSTMLALSAGVPVLAAGTREGKNDVNARIDHFGVGIDLRSERPRARAIARGVRRILGDARYAARAAVLRDELRSYDPLDLITHEVGVARTGAV